MGHNIKVKCKMGIYMEKVPIFGLIKHKLQWNLIIINLTEKLSIIYIIRISFPDGSQYDGEVANGLRNGYGVF